MPLWSLVDQIMHVQGTANFLQCLEIFEYQGNTYSLGNRRLVCLKMAQFLLSTRWRVRSEVEVLR